MGGDPETPPEDPQTAYGFEGYGYNTGGANGTVIMVTNLNNDGEGSLRAACLVNAPRTIRFAVSGTIECISRIPVMYPNVTIDGSDAPNGGICIKGPGLEITTQDVIVRHIRVRPGVTESNGEDGIYITPTAQRVMIDHCSLSWAQDENISIYGKDVTIQWCIISEGLSNSGHADGEHSKGAFFTGTADRVSFHHNLIAHNTDRNPYAMIGGSDVINNVLYNGGIPAMCEPLYGNVQMNFIKNWQRSGVNTQKGADDASLRLMQNQWENTMQAFVVGCIGPRRANNGIVENAVIYDDELQYLVGERFLFTGIVPVTETDAFTARDVVLLDAGATLPKRDAIDARIVADVGSGTGSVIDDPAEVGGWVDLTS